MAIVRVYNKSAGRKQTSDKYDRLGAKVRTADVIDKLQLSSANSPAYLIYVITAMQCLKIYLFYVLIFSSHEIISIISEPNPVHKV